MAKPMLMFNPKFTVFDNTGSIAIGAQVFFYQPGTTTKVTTYTSSAQSVQNPNPMITDSAGRITDVYVTTAVKVVAAPASDTDPPSSPYWTEDNITTLGQLVTVTNKSSNYTLLLTDRDKLILYDTSSGAVTINLPDATTAGNGFNIKFKKIDSSSNSFTVQAYGSQLIDGSNTLVSTYLTEYIELYCNGTAWYRAQTVGSNFSTLQVSGNTTIGGTLAVTGAATFASTMAITGNTTVSGTFGATGNSTFAGTLTTTGVATFSTGATITAGGLTVTAGNITASSGGLNVSGTMVAGQGLTATTGGIVATAGNIVATTGSITATANNVQAGSNSNQGKIIFYPSSNAAGHVELQHAGNNSTYTNILNFGTTNQATTYTIADPGATTANIVLDTGTTTMAVGSKITMDKGTGTESGNAVTINAQAGTITTSSLTTGTGSNYAITFTNSKIASTSVLIFSYAGGTNTITNFKVKSVCGSGSATVTIYNNSGSSLNGTILLNFLVV